MATLGQLESSIQTTRLACSQLFHPACKISQAGVGDVCYELIREDTHTYVCTSTTICVWCNISLSPLTLCSRCSS